MGSKVLPFKIDRYSYRADGDFWLRTVCRVCDKKYEVYALAPISTNDLCGECQEVQRNLLMVYGPRRPNLPSRIYINGKAIFGFVLTIGAFIAVAWFLLWAGLTGHRYVDGVVNAIKEALR